MSSLVPLGIFSVTTSDSLLGQHSGAKFALLYIAWIVNSRHVVASLRARSAWIQMKLLPLEMNKAGSRRSIVV